jgi:tetrahydromethanopterin S-methyltransferase subunit G
MSSEYYAKAINSRLSHGLEFEKKYIESTINKMLKVELGMVKRELKQVKNSLTDFEKRHKMSSDEFYDKFNAGKLGDDREYIKWYAYKNTFNKLMERLKEIEKVVHA